MAIKYRGTVLLEAEADRQELERAWRANTWPGTHGSDRADMGMRAMVVEVRCKVSIPTGWAALEALEDEGDGPLVFEEEGKTFKNARVVGVSRPDRMAFEFGTDLFTIASIRFEVQNPRSV
jgi:hypothetical protein